jgi:N-acetylglucosaminyldiphosphoundecaprenol N-acetyl-beta-D-mannosaminyltransferase
MSERERIDILGIPVDRVNMQEAAARFRELLETEDCSVIVTPNSEILLRATKEPDLGEIIRRAALVIPDGVGLLYASRILKQPLEERVTGIDFLSVALEQLAARGGSVYLLGSKEGVASAAAEKMQERWPDLRIAGTHHGYFTDGEAPAMAAEIAPLKPDLLVVALGSPRQERFMADYGQTASARTAIGVGGSLDVWAGTVRRAPEVYRRHWLEWLYRIVKQPSRLKRSAALPAFMLRVLFSGRRH